MFSRKPDELIKETLDEVIDKFLIPRFMQLGMNATGNWLRQLETDVIDGVGYIKGEHYTEQLVFGRKGGTLPPPKAIERWVNAKLGVYGKEAVSMSWAIAKKIEREGTTWYKKGGSDLLEVLEEPTTLNYIYEKIGNFYKLEIANELRRQAKEAFA